MRQEGRGLAGWAQGGKGRRWPDRCGQGRRGEERPWPGTVPTCLSCPIPCPQLCHPPGLWALRWVDTWAVLLQCLGQHWDQPELELLWDLST